MCKCNGESVDYLFHCPLARELWDILFCLVGITWVMPYSVIALLESWRGFIGARRSRDVWGAAPACLMWCIWREQNQHTFEGVELSLPNLKFLFLKSLYDWCSISPVFCLFFLHSGSLIGLFLFFSFCIQLLYFF
jgi:hypothetical protein